MTRFIGETRSMDEPQHYNTVIVDADSLSAANAEVLRTLPSDWHVAWLRQAPPLAMDPKAIAAAVTSAHARMSDRLLELSLTARQRL